MADATIPPADALTLFADHDGRQADDRAHIGRFGIPNPHRAPL